MRLITGLASASLAAMVLIKGWSLLWAIPFALWFTLVFVTDMNRSGDA